MTRVLISGISIQHRVIFAENSKYFRNCQHYRSTRIRFKVSASTKDNLVFGDKILFQLIFLDDKAVLQIVHTAARISADTFLNAHN